MKYPIPNSLQTIKTLLSPYLELFQIYQWVFYKEKDNYFGTLLMKFPQSFSHQCFIKPFSALSYCFSVEIWNLSTFHTINFTWFRPTYLDLSCT